MDITKQKLQAIAMAAVAVPAVVFGARLVYGVDDGPAIEIPPILALPAPTPDGETSVEVESDAPTAEVEVPDDATIGEVADQVVEHIGSGEIDFFGVMTTNGSDLELAEFENEVGTPPDVIQISIGWELDGFDPSLIERIVARGALPSIAWEPWDYRPDIWDQPEYSLSHILEGDYDAYIDEWATGLADNGQPVLLRFAHEANGDWYPWSETRNGNAPGEYVETWRYVHDRFEQAGADNVIWVWGPNVNPFDSWPMEQVYPGDDYVDLVGLVGYWGHFGETPSEVGTFDSVFGASIEEVQSITQKPIFISETAATEEGGFKAEWIDEFLTAVAERQDVVGFIWFEVDKEADWRVSSSPESLEHFIKGLELPAFVR